MADVSDTLAALGRLRSARRVWEAHWQDLAETMLPKRADFTSPRTPGEKRTQRQFDATPMQAARGLAAAIDALLKSKTTRWFSIRAENEQLNEDAEVKAWLRRAEDEMFAQIYNPDSRFLQRSAEIDLDLVVFGTGILFMSERRSGTTPGLLFQSAPLNGSYLEENDEGRIDTVYRCQKFTARQAELKWGIDALGAKTREALTGANADPGKMFEFVQVVKPRRNRDRERADARNMPFSSVVVDVESEHVVNEGGFREFPFVAPRWDTASGEVYGRSPGMLALPDVESLHQMGKTILRAGHKVVDPPLLAPNDGITSATRTWPGGITYYDAETLRLTNGRPPVVPLQTGANLPLGREMQNDVREQVWSAFFRNVLQLPTQGPQMTATEILERREEFLRTIGPTFGRLEADYTGPLVERAFNILLRAGAFPVPPVQLQGEGVTFEYVSPITRAQKQIDAAAMRKTVEDVAPLVTANPDLLDNWDDDRIVRDVSDANGLPTDWLRPPEAVRERRESRAEAQRREAELAGAERLAAAGKTGAEAIRTGVEAGVIDPN